MTRKTKKTTIITETDRLLILNRQSGAVAGWCDDCDELAGLVRSSEGADLAGFRLQTVYGALRPEELCRVDTTPEGLLHAYVNSLLKPA